MQAEPTAPAGGILSGDDLISVLQPDLVEVAATMHAALADGLDR